MSDAALWPPPGTTPLDIEVVSVQSQVVYGRVGNNAAMPVLQANGLEAVAVPTVILSNEPHYASMHGGTIPQDWFDGFLDDLVQRQALQRLRAVITGYLGSSGQARSLASWLQARLLDSPDLPVYIDPVIGDHSEGIYVDPALVQDYQAQLMPLACGLTPNEFELGHLSGMPVATLGQAITAARALLQKRTQWVIATSAASAHQPAGKMQVLVVSRDGTWLLTHPVVHAVPKGTGDVFSATLASRLLAGDALPQAAACACQNVLNALQLSAESHCAELILPADMATSSGADILIEDISARAPA